MRSSYKTIGLWVILIALFVCFYNIFSRQTEEVQEPTFTQLLTKIRDAFGVDLSLLSLFDHPTLEGMSIEVENLILAKVSGANGANGSSTSRATTERSQ